MLTIKNIKADYCYLELRGIYAVELELQDDYGKTVYLMSSSYFNSQEVTISDHSMIQGITDYSNYRRAMTHNVMEHYDLTRRRTAARLLESKYQPAVSFGTVLLDLYSTCCESDTKVSCLVDKYTGAMLNEGACVTLKDMTRIA